MTQTVSGFTVPAGSDPVSSIDDTLATFAGEVRTAITAATEIPSQTGNSGKYLTTDGTSASWGTIASSGGYTQLASGSLSNSALNLTSISGSYKKLVLVVRNLAKATAYDVNFQFNGVTSSNYAFISTYVQNGTAGNGKSSSTTAVVVNGAGFKGSVGANIVLEIEDYANTAGDKSIGFRSIGYDNSYNVKMVTVGAGHFASSSAISSIQTDSSFVSGDYVLLGVK